MFSKLLLFALLHSSSAVLHEFNDDDYALMPPIYLLDDYEQCLQDPEGLYCTAEFAAVSDEPSALLTVMHEYSQHTAVHYNHTNLRRGVCITQSCKNFYEKSEGDLGLALEACANETLFNKYNLKARVSNGFACSKREKNQPLDYIDISVGVVCAAIMVLNIVASFCDYFFENGKENGGLKYLYCFSVFWNWNNLMTPSGDGNPRLKILRGLHGIRVMNMMLVIGGHSAAINAFLLGNTSSLEYLFSSKPYHLATNGNLIMQTFLLMSSFLLVFMMLMHSEKHEFSWKILPRQFFLRWLRLTPSYGLILALTATWFGRLASGPYWKKFIGNEMSDCRRYWWMHLLYVNNYFDKSECMVQSWYLAVDYQLSCLAAIIFVMCRTPRSRKVVLSLLFVLGVVVSVLETYYRNLKGVVIISPEFILNLFQNSRTFDGIYKRTHGNLSCCALGMAAGYWVYYWQRAGSDTKYYQKYRSLYWALVPLGGICCYSGTVYLGYSEPPSLTVNLLFAALQKPFFAIVICLIVVGLIVQVEDVYRTFLEWPGWAVPSRLSFSAYLVHIVFLRNHMGMQTTTYNLTVMLYVIRIVSLIVVSFISAFFFWILVEGPFSNLIREYFATPKLIEENRAKNKDFKDKEDSKTKKTNKDVKKDNRSPKNKGVAIIINNIDIKKRN